MKRGIRILLGVTAVLVGLVGLVVPILQGWLFLALGALLLSVDFPVFDRLVTWIAERFPAVAPSVKRLRNYLRGSPEEDT